MYEGIDVSKHNGTIDWKKVAAAKKFAFIRVGWAGYDGRIEGNGGLDAMYHTNMKAAIAAGVDVGVYVYSYCKTAAAARTAAAEVLELVKPYKLTYPIAFDIEDGQYTVMGKSVNTAIVQAFLAAIEGAKYYGILYSYKSFVLSYLNMADLKAYDFWLAHYTTKTDYTGPYGIWQHHGDVAGFVGNCPGVTGACDLNTAYKDYPSLIRAAGKNNLSGEMVTPPADTVTLAEWQELSDLYDKLLAEHKRLEADFAEISGLYDQVVKGNKNAAVQLTQAKQDIAALAAKWPL